MNDRPSSPHTNGACGITEAHSDEDHAIRRRITKALDLMGIVSRRATPGVVEQIARLADPSVERIASVLYLSGSKGGKDAAIEAAKTIRRQLY